TWKLINLKMYFVGAIFADYFKSNHIVAFGERPVSPA
ncbi:MAG: hypothetical protein ACI8YI_001572, partial [Paracoccaceae bacterium]